MRSDLLVLGAGPAGLAVAREAAARGLRVTCAGDAPEAPWERSFAVWATEATELGDLAPIEAEWHSPRVELGDRGGHTLQTSYCRLDVPELQRRILTSAAASGVSLVAERASAVEHTATTSRVVLATGRVLEADVVVDATGGRSPWVQHGEPRAPAFQTAFGQLLEVDSHPYRQGEMALMDYRLIPGEAPLPTFLYALPLGPRRIFLEETSLAGRPPVDSATLERRLAARLDAMEIRGRRVVAEERCVIPLGGSLPRREQRVLPFGAAAGMVHPATGYQLARALLLAPVVAARLAGSGSGPERVNRAHDAIWPPAQRRAWELYTFGMEAMLRLDHDAIRSFFGAFFSLKPAAWLPYLQGTATPAAISWTMLQVLAGTRGSARWELCRMGRKQSRALYRAVAGAPS